MSSCSVIEGGYFRDILDQPRALEATLAGFEPSSTLAQLRGELNAGRYRQIVLTGMGSSYHAFHPLLLKLAPHCVPVVMVETSELIHYQPALLGPATLLIVLSQSGRSAEIVRLLEIDGGRSCLVGITNDAQSPLGVTARVAVVTNAGVEYTVSSKTYLACLAGLDWLGEHLSGGDLGQAKADLAQAPGAVASYLADWKEHVAEVTAALGDTRDVFVVGRGPSLAAAGTGGLIVKESTHLHSEGMSAAAFRHGPYEMTGPSVFVMVFEGEARTAHLNQQLAADVVKAGGRAAVVGESAAPGAFRLPSAPARLRPLLEILPVQMVTLALAAREGREAGAFALATKITRTE